MSSLYYATKREIHTAPISTYARLESVPAGWGEYWGGTVPYRVSSKYGKRIDQESTNATAQRHAAFYTDAPDAGASDPLVDGYHRIRALCRIGSGDLILWGRAGGITGDATRTTFGLGLRVDAHDQQAQLLVNNDYYTGSVITLAMAIDPVMRYWLELECEDNWLRGRIWAEGTPRPDVPQLVSPDAGQRSRGGRAGIGMFRPGHTSQVYTFETEVELPIYPPDVPKPGAPAYTAKYSSGSILLSDVSDYAHLGDPPVAQGGPREWRVLGPGYREVLWTGSGHNPGSIPVPPRHVYQVEARDRDANGNYSHWSLAKRQVVSGLPVPANTSRPEAPTLVAQEIGKTTARLVSSNFVDPDGGLTPTFTRWQIARDKSFLDLVYDTGTTFNNPDLLNLWTKSLRGLTGCTLYYARVAYSDGHSFNSEFVTGPWSSIVRFKTLGCTDQLWTFGDGTDSEVWDPSHAYSAPGSYTVCFTLTDYAGQTDRFCQVIRVLSPLDALREEKVLLPHAIWDDPDWRRVGIAHLLL